MTSNEFIGIIPPAPWSKISHISKIISNPEEDPPRVGKREMSVSRFSEEEGFSSKTRFSQLLIIV
jgi:hypothetical protein